MVLAPVAAQGGQPLNPVQVENQRPGTTRWQSPQLTRRSSLAEQGPRPRTSTRAAAPAAESTWLPPDIHGYPDQPSVNRGGVIRFQVSSDPAKSPTWDLEVYRMGWYGGAGARLVHAAYGLPSQLQPVPPPDPTTGLIAPNWAASYTLQTDPNWPSGVYLAKLVGRTASSYVPFVVRADGAPADILYQVPITTWQAYNAWGGKSLYDYQSPGGRAYKVSFDRPYHEWGGAGLFFEGDYNAIRWLERQGYNVTYVTSLDVHTTPAIFQNRKVFVSFFHDEYWSKPMRDHLTAARDAGVHLAFFDSNNVYWQVRFEPSASGVPNRVMVCYKDAALDPGQGALTTVQWRDPPVNQPENALLGSMFESMFDYGTSFPWVATNASHWIYAGTGLRDGDQIPGLVGYEYDKVWNNGRSPAGLVALSASPVTDYQGITAIQQATYYRAPSGAMVFNAATNYWPWKLDDNDYQRKGADARVQRMTANLLAAMIANQPGAPPPPPPTPTPTSALPPGVRHSWDAPGDTEGWLRMFGDVTSVSQSSAQAYLGSGSLQVGLALRGNNASTAVVRFPSPPENWTAWGTTLRAWVYVPANAPAGLQAQLVIQNSQWSWNAGPWTTLAPGAWQEIRLPNAPLADVAGVVVQFQGPAYTGNAWIDAVEVLDPSRPTTTVVPTATPLPSPTTTPVPTATPLLSPTTTPVPTATPLPSPTATGTSGNIVYTWDTAGQRARCGAVDERRPQWPWFAASATELQRGLGLGRRRRGRVPQPASQLGVVGEYPLRVGVPAGGRTDHARHQPVRPASELGLARAAAVDLAGARTVGRGALAQRAGNQPRRRRGPGRRLRGALLGLPLPRYLQCPDHLRGGRRAELQRSLAGRGGTRQRWHLGWSAPAAARRRVVQSASGYPDRRAVAQRCGGGYGRLARAVPRRGHEYRATAPATDQRQLDRERAADRLKRRARGHL
jgi:hypothetical protein